jgi:hypothetical protein
MSGVLVVGAVAAMRRMRSLRGCARRSLRYRVTVRVVTMCSVRVVSIVVVSIVSRVLTCGRFASHRDCNRSYLGAKPRWSRCR